MSETESWAHICTAQPGRGLLAAVWDGGALAGDGGVKQAGQGWALMTMLETPRAAPRKLLGRGCSHWISCRQIWSPLGTSTGLPIPPRLILMSPLMVVVLYSLSRVRLCVTPWPAVHQAPLPMGFSRQGHWSGLSFPPPGDLPDPEIKSASPALHVDSL